MDEQLYLMGLGLSLEEKVKRAIATFQLYEPEALKRDPVNGYYLCDSYGKDSGVILHLAKASGVKFMAHHNLTTLDPPELIYHGRKHHPETIVHKPKMAMLTRLALGTDGPPTRKNRWCCSEYKESNGRNFIMAWGVRAAESNRRKSQWRTWTPIKKTSTWVLNPILFWSDSDVWEYTHKNNIPYCSLYNEGFTRLGCIGCPQAAKQRFAQFKRWPKYEKAWKKSIKEYWNKTGRTLRINGKARAWVGKNINNADDLWRWWMEEMPKHEDENDCQMGLF
jgi:phosphoadenosine phosphosulfate reductase